MRLPNIDVVKDSLRPRPVPGGIRADRFLGAVRRAGNSLIDSRRTPGLIVGVAAAAGTEIGILARSRAMQKLCKPLIVPGLTAHTIARGKGWQPLDTGLLAGAAALHTLGDIVLLGDAEKCEPTDLTPGELAFGAGHILGLVLYRRLGLTGNTATRAAAVGVAAGAYALRRATGPTNLLHDGVFAAYAGLLAEYAGRGISALWSRSWDRESASLTALGGISWLASDALIAVRLWLRPDSLMTRVVSLEVMELYSFAQFLVLSGVGRRLTLDAGRNPDA